MEMERVSCLFVCDHTTELGSLKCPDGSFTKTPHETLNYMMATHFPDSALCDSSDSIGVASCPLVTSLESNWAEGTIPEKVDEIFTQARVENALQTFQPFKSAGVDGIFPALLQKGEAVLVPLLTKIFKASLRLNYIPSTALHTLVTKIEKSLSVKEMALCAFLDIEGAFDNTSYSSMARAMQKRNFDKCIVEWIHTMLAKREITSELGGSSIKVRATKGCPQGGVLSPLLWSLVVDDLLRSLEEKGFEVVGFADDIVIIVRGKFDKIVSERMQLALKFTQFWCIKEGLSINPSKAVIVPFTKRRKFNLKAFELGGERLQVSEQVKYLGVILDAKLNWNAHLDYAINKATCALWLCSKTVGRRWGLKPNMTMWIYTSIIRPKITYASLVWWPKTKEATAAAKLAKLQRLACIAITGAMRSTPSKALDSILNLLPLHEFVQLEAERSALKLKRWKSVLPGDLVGHLSILTYFNIGPVMDMCRDWMIPVINNDIPYRLCETSRTEWEVSGPNVRQGSLMFYTDGSKIGTKTGAGIFGPGIEISVPMGHWATVFQAEIFAILECTKLCLRRNYRNANICIFSDSEAALKALFAYKCTSKIVWECILALRQLCQRNSVNIGWVPGHSDIYGNEKADEFAKLGSNTPMIGPEPFCGVSDCAINMILKNWEKQKVKTKLIG